jgi:hypothetical protein
VVEPAVATRLPDEAVDITTNEFHLRLLFRLVSALSYALAGQAAVLGDIFVRSDHEPVPDQAAPDVLIAPGVRPGGRTVYRLSEDPVPAVTVEVLSPANREREGRALLEKKRAFFGRIGVPLHLEVDPDQAVITVWERRGDVLVPVRRTSSYSFSEYGGVRVETTAPGEVRVYLPDGRELGDAADELARADEQRRRADEERRRADEERRRADEERRRADEERRRADEEQRRADQLAARLRALGFDPDAAE